MPILSPVSSLFGRKASSLGEFWRKAVKASESTQRTGKLRAEVSGRFRFKACSRESFPAVGDWVALRPLPGENRAIIEAVLPRKSQFIRKAAGKQTEAQVVGANMDWVFVMMSLNQDFNARRLERYLVLAWESGASPVVILSKSDLCNDKEAAVATIREATLDVPIHAHQCADRRRPARTRASTWRRGRLLLCWVRPGLENRLSSTSFSEGRHSRHNRFVLTMTVAGTPPQLASSSFCLVERWSWIPLDCGNCSYGNAKMECRWRLKKLRSGPASAVFETAPISMSLGAPFAKLSRLELWTKSALKATRSSKEK